MSCKHSEFILTYLYDEMEQDKRIQFQQHLDNCATCQQIVTEYEQTNALLRKRTMPAIPPNLYQSCLYKIDTIKNKSAWYATIFEKIFLRPKLAWQFAVLLLVFTAGLGIGKMVFAPPVWLQNYKLNLSSTEKINQKQLIRNYLLSVEILLLDLTNLETQLNKNELQTELEVTKQVLNRTNHIKKLVQQSDTQLYQLLIDIEWVLEDVIDTPDFDLDNIPRYVQKTIEKQNILDKIHLFIS